MRISRLKRKLRRYIKTRDIFVFGLGALAALLIAHILTNTRSHTMQALAPQSSSVTIAWLPESVTRWRADIEAQAAAYDIDPNLIAIIMTIESGGNPVARSEAGAVGLMQIMPGTAQDISRKFLHAPVSEYNLEDGKTSIEFGASYLAYLRNEFGTDSQAPSWNATAELVAAGYNGGPGAASRLERGEGLTDPETVAYARNVYNMWRERAASESPTYNRMLGR